MIRFPIPCIVALSAAPLTASSVEVEFNRDIRPILSDRCFACHGPDANKRKAELRLDTAEGPDGAYRTHQGSAALKPGSLAESEVWHRMTTEDEEDVMPPPEAHKPPLSKSERELVRRWIEQGAPYDDFWAFVPPRAPAVPQVKNGEWSHQPIDLHVLQQLESLGRSPSARANRRILIRRVTFDLTGLPPTREEISAFLADERPDAYGRLVDGLLASPRYGEHMTRYWLDLVRFADTNGMHKDFYRNFIAYRDWVIRAFNDNLRYDEFVRYQLAGDLYAEPSNDQLVASGFNRLHLIIDRGTALPEESHVKNVFDRVSAFGTVFLGMTVHCATCHDHKFDPLTQKDYYGLFAFFNNLDGEPETGRGPKNGLQPPFVPLPTPEQRNELQAFDEQIAAIGVALKGAEETAGSETDPAGKEELTVEQKRLASELAVLKKQRGTLETALPRAMVMKERADVRPAYFLNRGQYDDPGEVVARNTPAFLPELKMNGERASRMDLAEWMVERQHPLTARVAANRFWQQFFEVGIVKTSEDLGAQGEVPSHPELLDHLAVSFVDSGWDIKALVKQIVRSETYCQSSLATGEQFRNDPENRLLARGSRFRMDAEMVRDQILATSGMHSATMYGRSVKPPQPDGLWKAVTMTGERFKADSGDSIYRRSVYTFWKRAIPPPQMTILNAPNRDACIARRERTNTPSQALLLLNETESLKAARALAQDVLRDPELSPAQRLAIAYETITSQLPDETEQRVLLVLIRDLEARYLKNPPLADALCEGVVADGAPVKARLAAWTMLVSSLYNLDITKTRE